MADAIDELIHSRCGILGSPASQTALDAAMAQVKNIYGGPLPKDYQSFLRRSNGLVAGEIAFCTIPDEQGNGSELLDVAGGSLDLFESTMAAVARIGERRVMLAISPVWTLVYQFEEDRYEALGFISCQLEMVSKSFGEIVLEFIRENERFERYDYMNDE